MIHLQMIHTTGLDQRTVHNLIHNIWPAPYASDCVAVTQEDGFDNPTGEIFAIVFTPAHGYQPRIIGITGYFGAETSKGWAYLRWTGVQTAFRRLGYMRESLKQLTTLLAGANPLLRELIELVPDNEYGRKTVMPAFEALGFKRDMTIPVPVGEDADWPVVPYVLTF